MAENRSDDRRSPATDTTAAPARHHRIDGIDAARALAIFGMFVVHLGVTSFGLLSEDGATAVHALLRGNSSALFALLAGLSLAFMTGRTTPATGDRLRQATVRIVTRAVVIGVLGIFLDMVGAPVAVILTYYAGFFLLALPLARLRAGALWAVAGVLAVVGPFVSFTLRSAMGPVEYSGASLGSLTEFFLTGYYPAITFMAFVFAGMALGRTDLTTTAVRLRLFAAGCGLTVFAYGGSWLLLYPLGGLDRLAIAAAGTETVTDPAVLESLRAATREDMYAMHGQVFTDSWWWLAVGTPHTGTTFEIAQAVGQALIVIVACVWLAERVRWLMYPLSSVGRMSLTVYSGHLLAIAVVVGLSTRDWHTPWLLEGFVVATVLFAVLWRVTVGRGPMESCLGAIAEGVHVSVQEIRESREQRRGRG
ncbi:heparan-alpha-glucosaminide N-acetyltransferase domain-containing protein [Nocardiopsis sp. FIRDI 009]|uniref:heparan-alpha-glucosaminide N-acetyltransferase domain-containing protein n=1 Tax=Nocardiopsis sp. FIRDI 009 TaxID=714197 RepID=UPI000E26BB5B|nr:heparan-alpha-glucosaminide N-acetyltransferase domain-containing protein [Nocardiopsis sp. FIRDI 009]